MYTIKFSPQKGKAALNNFKKTDKELGTSFYEKASPAIQESINYANSIISGNQFKILWIEKLSYDKKTIFIWGISLYFDFRFAVKIENQNEYSINDAIGSINMFSHDFDVNGCLEIDYSYEWNSWRKRKIIIPNNNLGFTKRYKRFMAYQNLNSAKKLCSKILYDFIQFKSKEE